MPTSRQAALMCAAPKPLRRPLCSTHWWIRLTVTLPVMAQVSETPYKLAPEEWSEVLSALAPAGGYQSSWSTLLLGLGG
jgi:hypothetical protein